jgi:hypothetical protein
LPVGGRGNGPEVAFGNRLFTGRHARKEEEGFLNVGGQLEQGSLGALAPDRRPQPPVNFMDRREYRLEQFVGRHCLVFKVDRRINAIYRDEFVPVQRVFL